MFELRTIINKHGDLPIIGSSMGDDDELKRITIVDDRGCDAADEKTKPNSIFLTA